MQNHDCDCFKDMQRGPYQHEDCCVSSAVEIDHWKEKLLCSSFTIALSWRLAAEMCVDADFPPGVNNQRWKHVCASWKCFILSGIYTLGALWILRWFIKNRDKRGEERRGGGRWQKELESMVWHASTHCHLLASLQVISVQSWLWVNNGRHKWSSDPLFNFLILLDSSEKTEQPKQPITVLGYATEVKLGLR